MRKKLAFIVFSALLSSILLVPGHLGAAAKVVKVYIDGELMKLDPAPITENGYTLVPFRPIFEKFGLEIGWDPETWTVTGSKPGLTMQLTTGEENAIVDGVSKKLDVKPRVVKGFTFVPLRFVSESTGAKVEWDSVGWAAHITQPPQDVVAASSKIPQSRTRTVEEIGKQSDRIVYLEALDSDEFAFASGSGFVVSEDGIIVTNYHVIEDASKIKVIFDDGKEYKTERLLHADPYVDLALLQIEGVTGLPFVEIGDSNQLKIGEQVVAISSPLGYQNTVSTGIVSAIRTEEDLTFIQITAPLDHGSSGGALFNMRGEVVGITSSGVDMSTASLNFAIPSAVLKQFMEEPRTPVNLSSLNQELDIEPMERYLEENYGDLTWTSKTGEVYVFDPEIMTLSASGLSGTEGVSVSLMIHTADEYWNTKWMHLENETALAAILAQIGRDLHEEFGIEYFEGEIIYTYSSENYNLLLPSESQAYDGKEWFIWHPVQDGMIDFPSDTAYYTYDPNGVGDILILSAEELP